MDDEAKVRWDKIAPFYDMAAGPGPRLRWEPARRKVFSRMGSGRILFVSAGTGLEFQYFPSNKSIVAVDISSEMLKLAKPRAESYDGFIELIEADVTDLPFETASFDQVFISFTLNYLKQPAQALQMIHRVLKPGGELYLFEQSLTWIFPFVVMLNVMSLLYSPFGVSMNRRIVARVKKAGFIIEVVENIYLDVIKIVGARKA